MNTRHVRTERLTDLIKPFAWLFQGLGEAEEDILQEFWLKVIKFLNQQEAFLSLGRISTPV